MPRLPKEPDLDEFVKATIKFQQNGVLAVGAFDFFCRDVLRFVLTLETVLQKCSGIAEIGSDDGKFNLTIDFDQNPMIVRGHLYPSWTSRTYITFYLSSDQSYIDVALLNLRRMVD